MNHCRRVDFPLLLTDFEGRSLAEQPRCPGESEFGVVADEQGLAARSSRGEFSCNDRAGLRLQSCGQMYLILDENQTLLPSRVDAGNVTHRDAAIANQAGSHGLSDLVQCARYGLARRD